ncbi:MAG TPA: protein kinase [Gemmataceae bacterium]|nr:protein kinase [Gemmataceae bacterium]
MIAFSCSRCGKRFKLKPEFAGRKTTCSGCKEPLVVPDETAPALPKIAFSCDRCGMKFSVPGECAGRKTTCPGCKAVLVVPTAEATCAFVPGPGQIKGPQSSVAQVGVEGGVTLAGDFATAEALSMQNLIDGKGNDGARYVVEEELARGGMGAVMRAIDCDIRREVAVKYLLDQSDPKKKARFIEEAQITGQLEHPNIVPIHELGIDSEKHIFFSMKMVKGRSLGDILKGLRDDPAATERDFSQGRLLAIFVNICNALAYAHSRGVVHRDLKPANIMVGDFGEVYVMDWGLAKVMRSAMASTGSGPALAIPVAKATDPLDFSVPLATPVPSAEATSAISRSSKVVTSREIDADLTQQGAVLGTPVYMPPEQAAGKIDQIDERSDIYSMGAILYEIMTLQPPINKEGGYWPILMRVAKGEIDAPEKKAPERARAGKVPAELSAIAMKALAAQPANRYATIELLRKDIERFMEGRSVSAKQDTIREMAVKLVKRNLGVSIATAAAAAILFIVGVWSFIAILNANARTRDEQKAKIDLAKKSVPSFVRAAKLLISEKQFDDAFNQVDNAVNFDETDPDARFVRGQLMILRQEYAKARLDLEACLKLQPDRAKAKALLEIVRDARKDDKGTLLALADEFGRQNAHTIADQVARYAQKLMASREELLNSYQVRIESAWPGRGRQVSLDGEGRFHFRGEVAGAEVKSLEPLRGMPLSSLSFAFTPPVSDLTPLIGMPLTNVGLGGFPITDLTPLRGMQLQHLNLSACYKISDLTPLKGMPLKSLNLFQCSEVHDLSPLRGMKLEELILTNCPKIHDVSPLENMPLTSLNLQGCQVDDLTPLRGMKLPALNVGCSPKVHDLSSLKGMQLSNVWLSGKSIRSVAPLAGMKLEHIYLHEALELADLSGLEGMPITNMGIHECPKLRDLSALKGMPLTVLTLVHSPELTDLSPLRNSALTSLEFQNCFNLSDLSPLKGLKLKYLGLSNTMVKDLGPLEGMPLESLLLSSCSSLHDLSPLKGMKLKALRLGGTPVLDLRPLRGMPLDSIGIGNCASLKDLSGLEGMPLTRLEAQMTVVTDWSPLAGTKLTHVYLDNSLIRDLAPFKGMPLQELGLRGCKDLHDLSPLAGMSILNITLPPEVTKGMDAIRAMKSLTQIDGMPPEQFWKIWDASKKKGN